MLPIRLISRNLSGQSAYAQTPIRIDWPMRIENRLAGVWLRFTWRPLLTSESNKSRDSFVSGRPTFLFPGSSWLLPWLSLRNFDPPIRAMVVCRAWIFAPSSRDRSMKLSSATIIFADRACRHPLSGCSHWFWRGKRRSPPDPFFPVEFPFPKSWYIRRSLSNHESMWNFYPLWKLKKNLLCPCYRSYPFSQLTPGHDCHHEFFMSWMAMLDVICLIEPRSCWGDSLEAGLRNGIGPSLRLLMQIRTGSG